MPARLLRGEPGRSLGARVSWHQEGVAVVSWGPPGHGPPPGHLPLVKGNWALATEGGSLGGRAPRGERARWCTVRNWARLVVLRGVVLLWGTVVGGMVDNWSFRDSCCLLGCCCMVGRGMGCVAGIVVTSTMVLCMMFPVMLSMMLSVVGPMVAMVASSAIWGCKGSPNNQ